MPSVAYPQQEVDSPNAFELLESQVRVYSRVFPAVFESANGCWLTDEHGRRYLDFFSGAGSLNYGHNNPRIKQKLVDYLLADGITHSLDMATVAKRDFLLGFEAVILKPRGLNYKVQFTGPTGTNAVEAALKLARKATGRQVIIYCDNSFHGMSMGSLAVSGNLSKRSSAGVPLHYSFPILYDDGLGSGLHTLDDLEALLESPSNGLGTPAAVIVETIQAEGGVRVATTKWLQRLEQLARAHGILFIVDDIQVGCGRTGDFFSFEESDITPDIVCLSKSISGYGLPMSLLLIHPKTDVWEPGEHTGTFRGNNLAFVAATAALSYWNEHSFSEQIKANSIHTFRLLHDMAARCGLGTSVHIRGRGLIQAIVTAEKGLAQKVSKAAFERGLIIETCGPHDEALKLLPPLTITQEELTHGICVLGDAFRSCLKSG